MSELVRFRLEGEDRDGWMVEFAEALKADGRTSHASIGGTADREGLAAADPTTVAVVIETTGAVLSAAIAAFATIRSSRASASAASAAPTPAAPPAVIVINGARDSVELPIELAAQSDRLAAAIDAARSHTGAIHEVALESPW